MSLTCMNPVSISFAVTGELADCLTGAEEQTGGPTLTATGIPKWF